MLPFDLPDIDVFFEAKRRVVAHYFQPFPLSIDNKPPDADYYTTQYLNPHGEKDKFLKQGGYLRARPLGRVPNPITDSAVWVPMNMQYEVEMMLERGVTGINYDLLSLSDASPTGRFPQMLAASQAVDYRFWVIPMFDMNGLGTTVSAQNLVDIILTYSDQEHYPTLARLPDGRIVFAAYNPTQPIAFWQEVISLLAAKAIGTAFIPVFLGSPTTSPLDAISLGVGNWGTAIPSVAKGPAAFMNPALPQQFRPKDCIFWESQGFETYRQYWHSAIRDGSTYVQPITWNDYSESGQMSPYTDLSLATDIGTAFYDLTAYYGTWFVTGEEPEITRDVLYWCYRKMPSTAAHPNQETPLTIVSSTEVSEIELLCFLVSPATVSINGTAFDAPAGISSFKVPPTPGNPTFSITRTYQGPVTVYGEAGSPAGTLDVTYWSGSFPA